MAEYDDIRKRLERLEAENQILRDRLNELEGGRMTSRRGFVKAGVVGSGILGMLTGVGVAQSTTPTYRGAPILVGDEAAMPTPGSGLLADKNNYAFVYIDPSKGQAWTIEDGDDSWSEALTRGEFVDTNGDGVAELQATKADLLGGSLRGIQIATSVPAAGDLDVGEAVLGEQTGPNGRDEIFWSTNGNRVSRVESDGSLV